MADDLFATAQEDGPGADELSKGDEPRSALPADLNRTESGETEKIEDEEDEQSDGGDELGSNDSEKWKKMNNHLEYDSSGVKYLIETLKGHNKKEKLEKELTEKVKGKRADKSTYAVDGFNSSQEQDVKTKKRKSVKIFEIDPPKKKSKTRASTISRGESKDKEENVVVKSKRVKASTSRAKAVAARGVHLESFVGSKAYRSKRFSSSMAAHRFAIFSERSIVAETFVDFDEDVWVYQSIIKKGNMKSTVTNLASYVESVVVEFNGNMPPYNF